MPINTSFSGNIPWLLTEPPTVALARGAQVGEGIAHQRLAQQQITLQAAQQAEQVARDRAIEAHRKIQEGIEQSQEARQQALFAKTASNELSRRIGMKMINDDLEIYMADHPDATPTEKAQATTQAVLKNADKVFPDGQGLVPFVQHAQDSIGRFGVMEATINAKNASAKASESSSNLRDVQAEKIKTETWLGPGNTATKPTAFDTNSRLYAEAQAAVVAADNARLEAQTPEERQSAEAAYQDALTTFKARERFAPSAGSEFNKQTVKERQAQAGKRLDIADTKLEKDMMESGFKVEHNPDGTKTLVPVARPTTQANVTAFQNTLNNGVLSAQRIQQIIPHINANTVGPVAAFKSIVVDRSLANLYPELADQERISAGQLMNIQAREMVRMMRSDSSITKDEQEHLISMMPRTEEILNSPARALPQIKVVARELANKARQAAQKLHEPIPDVLKNPVEIRADLKANKINFAEARKRIMASPYYISDADLKE